VIGYENRGASPDELQRMLSLLEQEMHSGAWGLSSGLIYPPGVFASQDELAQLAGVVRKFDGIYTSHMRSEGDQLIEALQEALRIGRQAGVPVQISHLKTLGKKNWHKLSAVFETLERARDRGVAVTADRYPYTASSTELDAILPPWAVQGGAEAELERLRRPELRDKIFSGILMPEKELADDILISKVFSQKNKHLEGKLLGQAAEIRKQKIHDALLELLIEEELQVDAIFFSMSEDNLKQILKKDYCMIGSDASVRDVTGPLSDGKPHPRGFGTFPRVIWKYAAGENILTLASAIRKMTGQPAEKMGLRNRGLLKKGHKADIVIFSLSDIHDRATYENPHQYPAGIQRVMVNGKWVLIKGALTGEYPGKLLLKTG
ncbi:MAG: amidohydrolase family protein, partial [Pseudomonadota bacterium]